ncbi:hypothetical protein C1645_829003 [Glomus cerebriforme]|uniref:RING-type domain-containing protein n=1 Tax=Glomus cerebriforme TaxID=658196 RepID=A0A397SRR8_9GLOM|nr:hypothetical protein C1645_829003 [Glomus cerebriforme]
MDKFHIEALAINIVSKANALPSSSENTSIPKVDPCPICGKDIYTLEFNIIKEFTLASCGHIFYQKCLEEYLVDGESSCSFDGCNRNIKTFLSLDLLKELQNQTAPKDVDNNDETLTEESTNQKKCTREDSNESCEVSLGSTSTSSKKAKKTKKAVDQDQSPTFQRLIKELTTTNPGVEEILQTEPASESNNDSNVFLNLYNKIVAGEDQLKKTTQDVLHHYFDFEKAMKKRYDHYRSLKHEDLASQSLVEDDVQNQLPNVSEEAFQKRIERAQKVYGLFSSINVDVNMGRAMIGRIKTFSLLTITALSKEDIKYVIVKVLQE